MKEKIPNEAIVYITKYKIEADKPWGELETTQNPDRRKDLIESYGSKLILASNTYASSMETVGLKGPYSG